MASSHLFLGGGARVTTELRDAVFDAANRAGMSVNEFAIIATAEKVRRCGGILPGVFRKGDLPEYGIAGEAA